MDNDMGKIIASLRKEKGLTQAELAQKLNASDKAVSKWESGGGFPSLEYILALATFFGVTTDYLLTGEKEEKQKSYSDLELCVKNGNIQRALTLSGERDENGKSVLDYAIEYKNTDMVIMMLSPDGSLKHEKEQAGEKNKRAFTTFEQSSREQNMRFLKELLGDYYLSEYCAAVLRLLPLNLERDIAKMVYHYGKSNDNSYSYNTRRVAYQFKAELRDEKEISTSLIKVCNYLVEHYEDLEKEQQEYYFGKTDKQTGRFECWRHAYPQFIKCAYEQGKTDLFKKLVGVYESKVFTHDDRCDLTPLLQVLIKSYESDKKSFNLVFKLFEEEKGNWENEQSFLDFILTVYKKHGREQGDKLNKIAGNHYSEDEIRCILIDADNEKTKAQKLEERCVYYGILWLDKVFETGDAAFLKKMFKKYPLTLLERLEEDIKSRNYKRLFEFAVDNITEDERACGSFISFSKVILKAACFTDAAKIPAFLNEYGQKKIDRQLAVNDMDVFNAVPLIGTNHNWQYAACDDTVLNKLLISNMRHLTGYKSDFKFHHENYGNKPSLDFAFELVKKEIRDYKTQVLAKLETEKEPKNKKPQNGKTDTLTRKYFQDLLIKGNYVEIVTKLCVKLDAYLIDCGYSGENLYERLNEYCDSIGQRTEKARILHRLRMARNSEVHPEEKVTLSESELKVCINTVFEITEGN